jgi:Fe-S-cluster containining protein
MTDDTRSSADDEVAGAEALPAGDFSTWLRDTREAQRVGGSAEVPCGACIGCCTSSYFIHIGPDESETLKRIPAALLFPAPGQPKGHVLLGYDAHGRCPMLVEGRCSIYAHRPQTCRSYDCRVFAATGIDAGGGDKDAINQRVRRWRFSQPHETDATEQEAARAAAAFLREHADAFPSGIVPENPTQLALLALEVYDVFVHRAGATEPSSVDEIAAAVVKRAMAFADSRPRPRGGV